MTSRIWHRLLLRAALSGAHVFAWIFVFQFFYVRSHSIASAIGGAALTYALAQVVAVLGTPIAAQRLRNGFRRTMVYAVLSLAAAFALLAAAFAGSLGRIEWGIALFALGVGAYRALYWIPYEVIHARGSERGSIAREFALAAVPALAGVFLATSSAAPITLLAAASALCLCSLIPLARVKDGQEGYSWGYRQTFHELFSKHRRAFVLSAFLGGAEASALLLFWPILVFMLVEWSYPVLGLIVALTYALTISAHVLFRRQLSNATPPIYAVSAMAAWVLRLTVGGAIGVVLVDSFFYTGSRAASRGVDMLSYEQSADSSTYVDEHTALKEMGMGMGRIALCLLMAGAAAVLPVAAAFALVFTIAALAAGASVLAAHARPRVL